MPPSRATAGKAPGARAAGGGSRSIRTSTSAPREGTRPASSSWDYREVLWCRLLLRPASWVTRTTSRRIDVGQGASTRPRRAGFRGSARSAKGGCRRRRPLPDRCGGRPEPPVRGAPELPRLDGAIPRRALRRSRRPTRGSPRRSACAPGVPSDPAAAADGRDRTPSPPRDLVGQRDATTRECRQRRVPAVLERVGSGPGVLRGVHGDPRLVRGQRHGRSGRRSHQLTPLRRVPDCRAQAAAAAVRRDVRRMPGAAAPSRSRRTGGRERGRAVRDSRGADAARLLPAFRQDARDDPRSAAQAAPEGVAARQRTEAYAEGREGGAGRSSPRDVGLQLPLAPSHPRELAAFDRSGRCTSLRQWWHVGDPEAAG